MKWNNQQNIKIYLCFVGERGEERNYCCCAAKSIWTSGGARAGDSTKWRLASLKQNQTKKKTEFAIKHSSVPDNNGQ